MTAPTSRMESLQGPLYMLLSCILFSIMGGLIRYLSMQDFHPFMTTFARTFLAICFLMPTFYTVGFKGLKTTRLKLHLFRGVVSAIAALASFYAVTVIPLASAVSYSFAAPVIATVLAVVFLKERIHLPRILAILLGFVGVLILLRPGSVPFSAGVGAALLSSVAVAFAIICIRSLSQTDKANVVAIYSLFITLPISFVFALFAWSWPTPEQWGILAIIGLSAASAQYSISRAFSNSETTAIMPIDFVRLLFSAAIGYFFYSEVPDIYTFVCASIILGSAVYAAHREMVRKKTAL
ncbi:MAG: DMT family transporter [Emcibacteraceae bacterium]|nr:DMT family transporter [Emcibacteraceae bacterium]